MMKIAFGGMTAEELFFGESGTGPGGDLVHATKIAAQMVGSFGMAGSLVSFEAVEGGPISQGIVGKVLGNEDARNAVEKLLDQAKADVHKLLDDQPPPRDGAARRVAGERGAHRRRDRRDAAGGRSTATVGCERRVVSCGVTRARGLQFMEDLRGRVVIVSNADTEHGAALARVVCAAGAAAVLTGEGFYDARRRWPPSSHGETGAPIAIFAGDLSRDDERHELTAMVSELFPN